MALLERASLHPIIAALLDRDACRDQVNWERYEHPAGAFEFCLGPQLTLFTTETSPPAGGLLDELLLVMRDLPLSCDIHTLRVFTCYQEGHLLSNEVLLDGEPWAAGQAVVAATSPPATTSMIGTRIFGLLVPSNGTVEGIDAQGVGERNQQSGAPTAVG